MRLREILNARKKAAQNAHLGAEKANTDNHVAEIIPAYLYDSPMGEFHALFKDCTEF